MATNPVPMSRFISIASKTVGNTNVPARDRGVLALGSPGIGKSQGFAFVAEDLGMDYLCMHPAVQQPEEFTGFPVYDSNDKAAQFITYGHMEALCSATRPTMVHMEDIGHTPNAIVGGLMQIFESRSVNGHKISDHVVFVGSANRTEDGAGAGAFSTALLDRFAVVCTVIPDLMGFLSWAGRNGIRPEVMAFLSLRPEYLNLFDPRKRYERQPTPRAWAKLSQHWGLYAEDEELSVAEGAVGPLAGVEFTGFCKVFRSLTDPEDIINDPKGAPIPSLDSAGISIMFAQLGALATRATKSTIGNIVTYFERLPKDYTVAGVRLCLTKNPDLLVTPAVIKHRSAHPEIYKGF